MIVDLAAGRAVTDREMFIRFAWRRLSVALEDINGPNDLRVWYVSARLLEQFGEDLGDIFIGRPHEEQVERDGRLEALMRENPTTERIAEAMGWSVEFCERFAALYCERLDEEA